VSDVFGVGKTVEKLMDPVTDLVKRLAGPAADEVGLSLQDSVKVWRAKRQYRLFEKIVDFIHDAGYKPNPVPLKLLLPALDYASVEDDDDLHTIWAALLANAADPRKVNPVYPFFLTILKDLTAREARFLSALHKAASFEAARWQRQIIDHEITRHQLLNIYADAGLSRQPRLSPLSFGDFSEHREDLNADLKEFASSLDLALRNGILRLSVTQEPIDLSDVAAELRRNRLPRNLKVIATTEYCVTQLGIDFIAACKPPTL